MFSFDLNFFTKLYVFYHFYQSNTHFKFYSNIKMTWFLNFFYWNFYYFIIFYRIIHFPSESAILKKKKKTVVCTHVRHSVPNDWPTRHNKDTGEFFVIGQCRVHGQGTALWETGQYSFGRRHFRWRYLFVNDVVQLIDGSHDARLILQLVLIQRHQIKPGGRWEALGHSQWYLFTVKKHKKTIWFSILEISYKQYTCNTIMLVSCRLTSVLKYGQKQYKQ